MKKTLILTLVLSALLLVTVMGVSVSADPSLEIGEITVAKDIQNNLVTFTVPYTAVGVKQVTVLAVKGTSSGEPVATDENIVYINQQSSEDGDSFVFSVPYDKFSKDLPYCWIKIGGTSIAEAKGPEDMEVWTPATPSIVYGDVNGDNKVNTADAILVVKYFLGAGSGSLDSNDFPNGTFPSGSDVSADVNGDNKVNTADAILIVKYFLGAGSGSLDGNDFPGGKFPADKN